MTEDAHTALSDVWALDGDVDTPAAWLARYSDHFRVVNRQVCEARAISTQSTAEAAGELLRHAYLFAVATIKTPTERAERAISRYLDGEDIRTAFTETPVVWAWQKSDWVEDTLDTVNFTHLAQAVERLVYTEKYDAALELIVSECKGVSYRKGAFTLAMSGYYEFACIDSHVAAWYGIEERESEPTPSDLEFTNAVAYRTLWDDIHDASDLTDYPPFIAQWAIFEYQRGEPVEHVPFYEVML